MRAFFHSLLFTASLMAAVDVARAAPATDAEARYQSLLTAAKAAAPQADWTELRLAYAARPAFKVFAQSGAKRQMFQAAQQGDCKTALPAAKAVIEETYVDADAHFVAAYCEDKSGDAASGKLDRDVAIGLIASIQTGDGLTPSTAFTPITVDEEYSLMRALGAKVTSQALIRQPPHSYDALTVVDAKGQKLTYFFLIDRVLAAEGAALAPG